MDAYLNPFQKMKFLGMRLKEAVCLELCMHFFQEKIYCGLLRKSQTREKANWKIYTIETFAWNSSEWISN